MTNPAEERGPAYHIVMISFEGAGTAERVVDRLKHEKAFRGSEIEGPAVISRDADGQIHLHEKGAAGIGAAVGATAAGLVGLMTGPVVLAIMLVGGAVAGGVAGHFAGQILPPDDLKKVAESLAPNTSAFIAAVDSRHASQVVDAFAGEGKLVVDTPVETELSSAVREGVLHHVRRI